MFSKLKGGFKLVLLIILIGGIVTGGYFAFFNGKSKTSKNADGTPVVFERQGKEYVIILNTWCGFAGLFLMNNGTEPNEDCRLYKEYGIKLRIVIMDVLKDSRSTFLSDNADIIWCTTDAFPVETGAAGEIAKANVAQFFQIDWSRGGDAIVVTKGINTMSDLKGRTVIYAEGTASNSLLIKSLETAGLSEKDVIFKKATDGLEAAKMFKAGEGDAVVCWSPDDDDCVKSRPGSKVIMSTKIASNIIADGLIAKTSFIEDKKDMLVKLCTAWLVANAEINTNAATRDKAAEITAKALNVEKAFAVNGINNVRFCTLGDNKNFFGLNPTYTGVTGEQLYTKMSIKYSDRGLTKNPLAWRNVSNTSIIETITLTDANQVAESSTVFSAPTKDLETKTAISSKKVVINFETGSYKLDDIAMSIIDREVGSMTKEFEKARIRIEGNTDGVGNKTSNKTLSKKRAEAVANYLVREYKFSEKRFIIVGNGSLHADTDGATGDNVNYRTTDFQIISE